MPLWAGAGSSSKVMVWCKKGGVCRFDEAIVRRGSPTAIMVNLNTSKAKLRGGRSPDRTAELQSCNVIINRNAHALYSMRMRTHSCRMAHNCYMERSQGVTQREKNNRINIYHTHLDRIESPD